MQKPFIKALYFVILLVSLGVFAAGLPIHDQSWHWRFIFFGLILFGRALAGLLLPDTPKEPRKVELTNRGAIIFGIVIFVWPLLIVASQIFSRDPGGLAQRCGTPEEPGAIEACLEMLRKRQLDRWDLAKVYASIGLAYFSKGQYDMAVSFYGDALTANPGYAKGFMFRCGAFLAKRDFPAAVKDCEEAIRINAYIPAAYLLRAIAYGANRQYENALRDFGHFLSLEPKNTLALNGRCEIYNILGKTDAALADCNAALALTPKDADTLDTRGFVYLKVGNHAAARGDFDAAIGLDARQAASYYGRALIERHEGDTAGADADFAEAVKIKPDVAEDIALLGLGG